MWRRTGLVLLVGFAVAALGWWLMVARLPEPPPLNTVEPHIQEVRVATAPPAVATLRV